MADTKGNDSKPGESKTGPVKPPVLDLKAREAATDKPDPAPETKPATSKEPPPARPKPSEPAPVSNGGFAFGAAFAGGLLGLAAAYGLAWFGLWPTTPAPAAPADPRLAQFSAAIPELETVTQTTQAELSALNQRIGALESAEPASPAATAEPVDLSGVETDIAALAARIDALATAPAPAAADTTALDALRTDLAALTTRLDEVAARVGTAESGLDTLGAAVTQTTATLAQQPGDIGAVLQLPLILSGFESAFATGRPYAAELGALRAATPNASIPTAIANKAETGLVRPDVIASRFAAVLPAMLAGRPGDPDAQWQDGALDWFRSAIALRPTGEIEGDSPEAVMSRLEGAIARRDFPAAEALLAELPAPMLAAGEDVPTLIAEQAEATRFLDTLRSSALSGEGHAMIRLASWIIGSLIIATLAYWLISLPGTLTLEAAGYSMQPRLGVAVAMFLVVAIIVIAVWAVIRRILDAPRSMARRNRERRREQGVEALSDAIVALQAGDPARARQLARDAQARLPSNAASRLLEARADLALGDMPAAREHYRALIASEKTAVAALTGLYDQARAQHRPEAALTFARKALALAPQSGWAADAVFDDLTRRGQWAEAVAMVNVEQANSREDRARKRRRQAVIETARAREAETSAPLSALDHALTALKLLPDFVPAALIAARIHINRGETRKAMSLLRRIWRATGHPDVAALYAHAQPGASAIERLKRLGEIIEMPPPHRAAAMALARAAIDAYDWPLARNALAPFVGAETTQGVASLMAEIEEGQSGDQGKAREWLARAVRAPRDPAWTADGLVSDEWEPISPVTGKLDVFEWKVPMTVTGRAAAEASPAQLPAGLPLPLAPAANPT